MKLGKVRLRDWNKKNQRLKLSSSNAKEYDENSKMNAFIDDVESQAKILFNKVTKERRKPSEFELTNLLNTPEVSTVLKSTSVMEVFSDFIESNKSDKAERTIKGYTTVKNYITRFQESTKYTLTWDNIDVNVYR